MKRKVVLVVRVVATAAALVNGVLALHGIITKANSPVTASCFLHEDKLPKLDYPIVGI